MTDLRTLLSIALAAGCAGSSATPETAGPTTPPAPAPAPIPDGGVSDGSVGGSGQGISKPEVQCSTESARPIFGPADLRAPVDALVTVNFGVHRGAVHRDPGIRGVDAASPTGQWSHRINGDFCASAADAATCAATQESFTAHFSREDAPLRADSDAFTPKMRSIPQLGMTQFAEMWSGTGLVTGGEVTWLGSPEDALSAVGPLDSKGDALLYASLSELRPDTNDPMLGGARVTCILPEGEAWRLRVDTMVSDGPIQHRSTWWTLNQDGTLTQGESTLGPQMNAAIGRMPAGLRWAGGPVDEVACWLAQAAHLEAASVVAFDILHRELAHHGAPASLLERIRSAREDEVRHARRVGELATALGASIPELEVEPVPIRSLEAIAIENAQEGLVRETWGAAAGLWQVQHAELPEVRDLMQEIAEDEVGHAELSRLLHAWLWERLDEGARVRVAAARLGAWRQMREGILTGASAERDRALGLPTGETALRMLDVLASETFAT